MSRSNVIQVYEHESIAYKGRHQTMGFTASIYKEFEAYFVENEFTPFFQLIPYGVRFNHHVGTFKIGATTIEVLPKAGKHGKKQDWRGFLIEMLLACTDIKARHVNSASLKTRPNAILEIYFHILLDEVELLMRQGLIKKYIQEEGNENRLRGRIIFAKQISQNLIRKERFYTAHTNYRKDHLIHQVLYEAILVIKNNISQASTLNDRLERLLISFPSVSKLNINPAVFDRITFNRKNKAYKKAIEIARLLLLNYRPDVVSGRTEMIALLFDMNALWEEFIFVKMRKALSDGMSLSKQSSKRFWESKTVRPDIVANMNEETLILDTKWKVIEDNKPSDNDLKQMFAYNHLWKSRKSILIYPKANRGQDDVHGHFHSTLDGEEHSCELIFVDPLEANFSQSLSERVRRSF